MQDSRPLVPVRINRVGVLEVRIHIPYTSDSYFISNAFSSILFPVDVKRRGAHLPEVAPQVSYPGGKVTELQELFTVSEHVSTGLKGGQAEPPEVSVQAEVTEFATGRSFTVYSESLGGKISGYGLEMVGINACPCAQATIARKTSVIHASSSAGSDIISHNQRIRVTVMVKSETVVPFTDFFSIVSGASKGPLSTVLTPDAEADLLLSIHRRPAFVEDVARDIAAGIAGISQIPAKDKLKVTCRSMESIHPHDLYAEIDSTFGEIRNSLKNAL